MDRAELFSSDTTFQVTAICNDILIDGFKKLVHGLQNNEIWL